MDAAAIEPVRFRSGRLTVLDQTLLPGREQRIELRGADDAIAAIRRLAVRGALSLAQLIGAQGA